MRFDDKKLTGRLIGFKVKIGLSRNGLVENIRGLEFLVDDSNCEIATWQGDTSYDPLIYEYRSGVPSTLDVTMSFETPWGE